MATPEEPYRLSPHERKNCSILIIDNDECDAADLRALLVKKGYKQIALASNHYLGLQKIKERRVSHVIFQATETSMSALDFLQKASALDSTLVPLAASLDPSVDDVFELLSHGARGYIIKPCSADALDDALGWATKGRPLSEAVLFAQDRNEAFAKHCYAVLDKLADTTRQARTYESAEKEILPMQKAFLRAVDVAKTFAKGGDEALIEAFEAFALQRAKGPSTRLGRFRRQLASSNRRGTKATSQKSD